MVNDMKKVDVINFFGGRKAYLARAVGLTPAAVQQWGDELPRAMQDRVIAAAVRKGIVSEFIAKFPSVISQTG